MNTKDLIRLGVPVGESIPLAHKFIENLVALGNDDARLEVEIFNIVANPPAFLTDELRGPLARAIYRPPFTPRADLAPWHQWGEELEAEAIKQMANACALPVAVAGALMPDAHVGYGLPIGGVLATDNAVIPYAVGVDIACRMKLTVYDRKANTLAGQRDRLANLIESETRFGMGCEFKQRRNHDVMDQDWSVSPVTNRLRDKAWAQLGTSGSGNHFVEFGAFTVESEPDRGMEQAQRSVSSRGHTSRCSPTRVRAEQARRSATSTANARWPATRTCQRNSSISHGSHSAIPTARNTGPQ
jgi:tRNA-splicing ligase RtcB